MQTAQPVEAAAVIGPDLPRDNRLAQALEAVERRAMFEEGTRNIVYEWVDRESGDVVGQFPAELALKMRAYWREQERVQAGAEKRDGISA